ncbi:efflux RND transporter permease subunit [Ginsengibacter hankyongi]|uniref:Efflux RND transporter permease subunit n=1 Tax=Ginsengibacter hankyongi TaxID=2607284 RepID=A0A5J5IED9_9BACT|nr:efflux RND transporter permease subunit [Ginsengibacter hankyongi]KAA9037153.1 efflux RND transporter permease subunit [Ginsengibacter hankyongi]
MNLTNFSVRNYRFTLVIFIMIAVVGMITLRTMPRAEDPQINPPAYPITIVYPGTSPRDMEQLVVKPIEDKLYELSNVDNILTTIDDGLAVITINFKYGENIDNKYQEVEREVNALKSDLPQDIYKINIGKVDPSDVNVLQIVLVSENASFKTLKKFGDDLKEQLQKVTDLKNVKVSGTPDQIVRIELQLDKIAALKIPLKVVLASLQSEDLNIPGGNINAGNQSFNVKTGGRYKNLDEVTGTVVYNANGKITYLRDIASVSFENDEEKHITRLNGHRCILVDAAQKNGANISQTQKKYLPVLKEFEKTLPANIKLVKAFDQADNVDKRLSHLGVDFLIAIGLVLFTLLPLGNRASLIVMVAIPLSLALGIVGLNVFGFSLNQLTIVGLVVALGLLVDDSIVVVENIERWLRDGYSKKEAAIKATQQITPAVIGCTAMLAISFLPMLFLPGGPGEFIRGLPMAVICSVLASMIVSLTVVPFLGSRVLRDHIDPEGNVFLRALKKGISTTYSRLMHSALHRPVLTLLIAFGLFAASIVLFPVIGFKLFPASEKPIFLVNVRMPQQTSLSDADRISRMVEDSLGKSRLVKYYTANIGKGNPQIYYNVPQHPEKSDFAQIFVQLDEDARPLAKKHLIDTLRARFASFPYARVEVKDFEQGPPIDAPIAIRIFGDDLDSLRKIAFQVDRIIDDDKGTAYVDNDLNTLKTDIKVNINRQKASTLGVFTADIDRTLRLAIAGLKIGTFTNETGDDYDVIVSSKHDKFAMLDVFKNLFVNNTIGTPIPLSQLATINFETSPAAFGHFDKNRFVEITAYTQKNVLANNVLKRIMTKLNAIRMPQGYYYKLSGEAESEGDAFGGGFLTVILLTIFLFVAILILQFKTFKGMLIVLSVIPLGVVGGVLMLWLSGNPMSFIAIIGFIGLAGIEVKNSILLVDFTNQLRIEGMSLEEAIEKAGEIRFLPVILTSLTAIGGLIPLALNPNPQISPLALVLIGGLISSTILSRIVTPVMYKLIPPQIEAI